MCARKSAFFLKRHLRGERKFGILANLGQKWLTTHNMRPAKETNLFNKHDEEDKEATRTRVGKMKNLTLSGLFQAWLSSWEAFLLSKQSTISQKRHFRRKSLTNDSISAAVHESQSNSETQTLLGPPSEPGCSFQGLYSAIVWRSGT